MTPHPADESRRLAERYASMSDGELELIAATACDLTEEAVAALRAEVNQRKLDVDVVTQAPTEGAEVVTDDVVTIARYRDIGEAMFAKSLLEDAGIECFLADENTVRMNWLYANAIGGMRLQVRASDADDAQAILSSPPADGEEAP
jgi:Putative prokaryotic signal transducing protein